MTAAQLSTFQRWSILVGASVLLSLAMGMRQSFGLFQTPVIRDIGITTADFSLATAIQNVVWGVTQPMTVHLQFRDVTLGYDRHPAVHHLSGDVAPGALVAVVGPNGAGKSTLFRGIVGILKPLAGSIELGGLDVRDIAYLPQSVDIDRSFPISVFDFVATGLWRSTGLFGGIGRQQQTKVLGALAAVGLNGFERRTIGTLSGGQMQRMGCPDAGLRM